MRRTLLLAFTLMSVSLCAAQPDLMPLPARIELRTGALIIDNRFHAATSASPDARLQAAVERFLAHLTDRTGIAFYPDASSPQLVIECRAAAPAYPKLGEDESYSLDVSPERALLRAPTSTGILRGLETLLQLAGPGEQGMRIPALHIEDQPRFPWRGFMLDVGRHWMPLNVVLRSLDAMAAVKLNVFHWHLSDDQGFRMESKRFPRLQQLGSDGHFYTQAQVREVVAFAAARGIRVIPEFDMPGHTSSWLAAYPELASAPGPYAIERTWGVFKPLIDPTRESTYAFLDGLIGEMTALFPDPVFHIGGDEVDDAQWLASPAIQTFQKTHAIQNSRELQAYFNHRVQAILTKHGKTMMGWDEVLVPNLAPETIIQSWRGAESLSDAARKGYRTLLSGGYYLDYLLPAATHYAVDPLDGEAASLSPAQASKILGGEACMWTEYVSPETVDSRVWPRLAAIAERFWSPQTVRDPQSMYARLDVVTRELQDRGLQHRSNYAPMLDRLTGEHRSPATVTVADAVEALGIKDRRDERKYSSPVPLNRFVDAARPESESVRHLTSDVQEWLATRDATFARRIRRQFDAWVAAPDGIHALPENYLLSEVLPVAGNLAATGAIGIAALAYLENGQPPPPGWAAAQTQLLLQYEKPKAETRLAAVRPVRILLEALSPNQPEAERPLSGNR